MSSDAKSESVFTRNSIGGSPGESNGVKKSSAPGGSIHVAYPQDNVHGVSLKNTMGGKMGGSDSNIGHSLSGASAVQRQK